MAKEPAGLRRWRLAHRKKSGAKRSVRMARRTMHRKKAGMTIPIAVIGGMVPLGAGMYGQIRDGNGIDGVGKLITKDLLGYNQWNGRFEMAGLRRGLFPILAGIAVHKIASATGINRTLAAAGVPFIRI